MGKIDQDVIQETVLEHFLLNHEIIYKKLNKAKEATQKSLNTLYKGLDDPATRQKEASKYDQLLHHLISNYKETPLLYEDLKKIEELLSKLPELIDKHYKILVNLDPELQNLLKETRKPKYKKALNAVRDAQSKPDPLSGLPAEQFETEKQELLIKPPQL